MWHADETLPLFEYLKEARSSSRPLTLAGFDTQFSSTSAAAERPAEFRELLAPLDGEWARQPSSSTRSWCASRVRVGAGARHAPDEAERLIAGYERLGPDRLQPALAGKGLPVATAVARPDEARPRRRRLHPGLFENDGEYSNIRDLAMADNVAYLLDELYPDRKIVVWAHNFHVQHAAGAVPGPGRRADHGQLPRGTPSARALHGGPLHGPRHRGPERPDRLHGAAAARCQPGGAVLESRQQLAFADLLGAQRSEGTAWMFEPIVAREWGVNQMRIVPRDQFDAIPRRPGAAASLPVTALIFAGRPDGRSGLAAAGHSPVLSREADGVAADPLAVVLAHLDVRSVVDAAVEAREARLLLHRVELGRAGREEARARPRPRRRTWSARTCRTGSWAGRSPS